MDSKLLRVAGFQRESIVDGPGIRYVIFTQGCPHRCPGCHNPETHDFSGGSEVSVDTIFSEISENPLLKGVTFSGGEPFAQVEPLLELAKMATGAGLDLACYTGYTFEQLLARKDAATTELLSLISLLIDGPFVLAERDLELKFRGSRNQRLVKCRESVQAGRVLLYE